jgi:hypothetical protein
MGTRCENIARFRLTRFFDPFFSVFFDPFFSTRFSSFHLKVPRLQMSMPIWLRKGNVRAQNSIFGDEVNVHHKTQPTRPDNLTTRETWDSVTF